MEKSRRLNLNVQRQPSAPIALLIEPASPPVPLKAPPTAEKPKPKKKLTGYAPEKAKKATREDVAAFFARLKERLWQAAELGDADTVYLVLRKAEQEAEKWPPGDLLDAFSQLVDGATDDGATALYVACKHGRADCARHLLKAGATIKPTKAGGFTPLWIAAQNGAAGCVELMLQQRGIKVNKSCKDGRTPLYAACEGGNAAAARLLLAAGASAEEARNDGSTPLIVAAYFAHVEVVELLLEAGAKLLPADEDGTALANAQKRQAKMRGRGGEMARDRVAELLQAAHAGRATQEGLDQGLAEYTEDFE
jgi:ankyrin repeat protein